MTASEISDGSKYMRHGTKNELRIGTIKDLCQEVGEGVTIEEEWTNVETILKTAAEESTENVKRLKGTLGMDGLTKSVNK
jgi:hypothetical protein